LNQAAQNATGHSRSVLGSAVLPASVGAIAAQQLLNRGRLFWLVLAFDPEVPQGAIHGGKRLFQRSGLVGDLEFEECAPLHDAFGPGGIGDTGQLNHDPVVPHLLDQRLLHPELVDPLPQDGERQIEVLLGIGGHLLGLIQLEGEMHAALKIEAALQGHPGDGYVVHDPIRSRLTRGNVPGEQEVHRGDYQQADDQQSRTNR
jgi:hypothetical protein